MANETTSEAEPLISPQAHPEYLEACEKVNSLSRKLTEVQEEAGPLRQAHGIKRPDPRRAAALRQVGRESEADAHERLADLDASAAVFAEAVERASKERDGTLARLEAQLATEAYRTHFMPVAREAVAAFFALTEAWDRVHEVQRELRSYGLSSPRLTAAADTFTETASPVTANPSPGEIDGLRRLLLSWMDADLICLEQARAAFPKNVRFV